MPHLFIGIDTGGTFTDLTIFREGTLTIHKLLSTPDDPSRAILHALERLGLLDPSSVIVHGSTVATNAVLERKGVTTGLITTAGFRDILEIARQTRPHLYNLQVQKVPPLVPREQRVEVVERLNEHGEILIPLDEATIEEALDTLTTTGVTSVAIALLFSFVNPTHERSVAEKARARGFAVSVSSEVLPEFREYERTSTVVLNAYVGPLMDAYLGRLEQHISAHTVLRIMQSNGGSISSQQARREAARTLLSGPAAGVVGAAFMAEASGFSQAITIDIGGTSTDVALINGAIVETTTGQVGSYPTRLPMIDIHTVGAGGGSIAWFDAGGALRVGPRSAGASPGPAAYARGGIEATVTDANVVLGRLLPEAFLGGTMSLDTTAAHNAISIIAQQLQSSAEEAALGIIRIVNANMEAAIRVISVERGIDPRLMTLVAFGGAGPLHACELATALRIPRVLVPTVPGVLSALGMLVADTRKDYVRTVMLAPAEAQQPISAILHELMEQSQTALQQEGFAPEAIYHESYLDIRYLGQSYELTISLQNDVAEALTHFHAAHEQRFGYSNPDKQVQIVNVRLKGYGRTEHPALARQQEQETQEASPIGRHAIYFSGTTSPEAHDVPVFQREQFVAGSAFTGPALITQYDTTTVVPSGWLGHVDAVGNLILAQEGEG
ncbi:MAG TPA: hydantoinase/oxoprolinase family protein [Ktedonobacteraceae bacterium]|jgi:N-methylhydantoinase A